jgi:NAD(P)-dependent dehydrogenase (short-subunit alcohol dehydrogenase family)
MSRQPIAHSDRRLTPLILDVTDAARIWAAAKSVESLEILVNNAGVQPYDDLSDRAALEESLAVNLFWPLGVTQAFLPLLTRSKKGSDRQQPVAGAPRALPRRPSMSSQCKGTRRGTK